MKSNQKDKRILKAAIAVALLIIVGGTFAWFTSQDEVTNRLTASQNYGVSITETFTPEDNWIPGQEINKDVSVINTGDIDAFVKVSLTNSLNLKVRDVTDIAPNVGNANDEYITLSENEVKALQSGGNLISNENDKLQVYQRSISDNKVEYVGYYVVNDSSESDDPEITYYAVELTGNSTQGFTAKYVINKTVGESEPEIKYDVDKNIITATYAGTNGNDIIINIKLDDNWKDNWTYDDDGVFYCKKILASGETSGKLVDALELDSSVTKEAYSEFTYDLTVNLNSIQATTDKVVTIKGKEHYVGTEAVNNDSNWGLKATVNESDDGTLEVTWSEK